VTHVGNEIAFRAAGRFGQLARGAEAQHQPECGSQCDEQHPERGQQKVRVELQPAILKNGARFGTDAGVPAEIDPGQPSVSGHPSDFAN